MFKVKDGNKALIYKILSKPRKDGVIATLVGYIKKGKTFWY